MHVGTFVNDDIPSKLRRKLNEMPGLVERKINDSTTVFTVGVFKEFSLAEAKQNELREQGLAEAFGANGRTIHEVAAELSELYSGESYYERPIVIGVSDKDELVFGVELRGFRLRIELE